MKISALHRILGFAAAMACGTPSASAALIPGVSYTYSSTPTGLNGFDAVGGVLDASLGGLTDGQGQAGVYTPVAAFWEKGAGELGTIYNESDANIAASVPQPEIVFDLGGVYDLSSVIVHYGVHHSAAVYNPSGVEILVDGISAGTFAGFVDSSTLPNNSIHSNPVTLVGQTGQMITLRILGTTFNQFGNAWLGLTEVEFDGVLSAGADDPNLAAAGTIDLGTIPKSPASAARSFQVTNTGASMNLDVTGLTFSNQSGGTWTPGALPTGIAPAGGTGSVNFTFDSGGVPGIYTATAEVASNDPSSPATIELSVEVEDGPVLSVPLTVDLGVLFTTDGPLGGQVPVGNLALATPLNISSASFTFGDTANFSTDVVPSSVAAGQTANITFTFDSGGVAGAYSADLEIVSDDPFSPAFVSVSVTVLPPPMAANAYQQAVLDDNPLLYWTFDELGGTANARSLVNDLSENELVAQGNATRAPSLTTPGGVDLGFAASFDGSTGTMFSAADLFGDPTPGANNSSPGFDFIATQLWAVEFWFMCDAGSPQYFSEAFNGAGTSNDPGLIYNFNAGQLEMFSAGGRTGVADVAPDTWHHVVVAFYGNSGGFQDNLREIYIDGVLTQSTADTCSSGHGLRNIAIGNAANGTAPVNGAIDEYAIYELGNLPDLAARRAHVADLATHADVMPPPPSDPNLLVAQGVALGTVAMAPVVSAHALAVTNNGPTQSLDVTGLSFTNVSGGTWMPGALPTGIAPGGGTGMVEFTFDSGGVPGVYIATAEIASNDPDSPAFAQLEIVVENGPLLEAPLTFSLGTVGTNPAMVNGQFTVSNGAAATTLNISGASFTFGDTANFTVDSFPAVLLPGQSGEVMFTFDSGGVEGFYFADLALVSDDPLSPTVVPVDVDVEGTPQLAAPFAVDLFVTAEPVSADGGITVSNAALATALNVTGLAFSGLDAARFTPGTVPGTLAPGESGQVTFTFDTGGVPGGPFVADAEISSDDPFSPAFVAVSVTVLPTPMPANAYQQAVLDDGPLLYWTFDEPGDTDNAQSLVNNVPANELEVQGNATRAPSTSTAGGVSLGRAASLDGSSGARFFAADLAPSDPPIANYALELWFRTNLTAAQYISETFTEGGTSNTSSLIYGFNAHSASEFEIFSGDRSGTPVTANEWHHVVVGHYDSGELEIYVDGAPAVVTGDFNSPWAFGAIGIGNATFASNTFNGQIDEYAVYDLGALADTAARKAKVADLASHYSVSEGGGAFVDLVINGYNSATSLLSVSVGNLPPGETFHLRTTGDLQGFTPLAPAFDFDSNTPQPFQVDTGGAGALFLQVFDGPTPGP